MLKGVGWLVVMVFFSGSVSILYGKCVGRAAIFTRSPIPSLAANVVSFGDSTCFAEGCFLSGRYF